MIILLTTAPLALYTKGERSTHAFLFDLLLHCKALFFFTMNSMIYIYSGVQSMELFAVVFNI